VEVDPITGYAWELYHVSDDFSEAHNLSKENPDKLKELQGVFYAEAKKYNVLPIDNRRIARLDPAIRPSLTRGRNTFIYSGVVKRIPEGAAPDLKNRSFRLTADITAGPQSEGVLATMGGLFGGWALLMQKGKVRFDYNLVNIAHTRIEAPTPLKDGRHTVVYDFKYDGGGIGKGGTGVISVNGKEVARGRIAATTPVRYGLDEGMDVGIDSGTPVTDEYDVPFRFTGTLHQLRIDLEPTAGKKPLAALE
jgi:arylsulfatase